MEHHGEALRQLCRNEALVAALKEDPQSAPLDERQRAMVDYALKLTREPSAVAEGDVKTLRAHGFSERAVSDIAHITAYFNFVNRLADGLGVELEEGAPRRES